MARRPKFTAPSNTQSITFALVSSNGSSVSGQVTSFNVSSANCTPAANPTSCTFTVPASAGDDVFQVTTYSQLNEQGTPTGNGTIDATATAGQTTVAPATLSGIVATIALQLPTVVVPQGIATTLPLQVVAKDAYGNTIVGSYANAITLTLADASAQTTLSATALPDSTTASNVTLSYKGGAMTAAATIGASASGVTDSNVTSASFKPDTSHPLGGEILTYNVSFYGVDGGGFFGPFPSSGLTGNPSVYQETVYEDTGVSFNGRSDAIEVKNSVGNGPNSPYEIDSYYAWDASANSATLHYLGGGTTGSFEPTLLAYPYSMPGTYTTTCAAPYQTAWIVPLPQSWDALSNTGACTTTGAMLGFGLGPSYAYNAKLNADGSYNMTLTQSPSVIIGSATANADGTANGWFDYEHTGAVGTDYAMVNVAMGTPQPDSTSIPAMVSTIDNTTLVGVPSPVPSLAPALWNYANWYAGAQTPNGLIPQPLHRMIYTNKGAASLPASCPVATAIIGSSPAVTEVDESDIQADPLGNYEDDQYQYFSIDGLGVVCITEDSQIDSDGSLTYASLTGEGAYQQFTTWLTSTTLSSSNAQARSKVDAMRMMQAGIFSVVRHHNATMRMKFAQMETHRS